MAKKKLIIIAIDGGTFDIINPLMEKGVLPALEKFKNKAVLNSTIPPGTGVAWASFSTGNNPGKTNIYDFTIVDNNSWKIKFVNRKLLGSKPLWQYLSENRIKSCFINIPMSYPPDKINGVIVSGIDAPSTLTSYTHPENLKSNLKEFNYRIEVSGLKEKSELPEQAIDILDSRIKTSRYLLKKDFDFFIVLFRASDVVQHFAWGKKEVEIVYKKIDDFIEEVRRKNKDSDLIIMSDHGHERVNKAFNVNSWLELNGYLKTNIKKSGILSGLGITREKIFKILERLNLQFLVKVVPRSLGKRIPTKKIDFEEAIITNLVDFKKTRAIAKRAVKSSQIFLNKESRGGMVKKSEEDFLKKEIIAKLKSFMSKNKINVEIYTKEELYGKNAKYAPDITIYMKEKGYDTSSYFYGSKNVWDETREMATHAVEGIILTDMKLNLKNPEIIDLAPTILKYFNVKKAKTDGKSLI